MYHTNKPAINPRNVPTQSPNKLNMDLVLENGNKCIHTYAHLEIVSETYTFMDV